MMQGDLNLDKKQRTYNSYSQFLKHRVEGETTDRL